MGGRELIRILEFIMTPPRAKSWLKSRDSNVPTELVLYGRF